MKLNKMHTITTEQGRFETDGKYIMNKPDEKMVSLAQKVEEQLANAILDTQMSQRPPDVILNADYLQKIITALGSNGLYIWIGSSPKSPVIIKARNSDATITLMPMEKAWERDETKGEVNND